MKTFLLDTLNRYYRFSENLDVRTTLCNKEWSVFNDSREKEVFIFKENGELIISVNGIVTKAIWQYISANKSLIIDTTKQSVMLHPAFVDKVIFSLQLDGTNEYVLLIDEVNRSSFQFKTLNDIDNYVNKRGLEEIKRIEQAEKEERKAQIAKEKEELKRRLEKLQEEKINDKINEILLNDSVYNNMILEFKYLKEKEVKNGNYRGYTMLPLIYIITTLSVLLLTGETINEILIAIFIYASILLLILIFVFHIIKINYRGKRNITENKIRDYELLIRSEVIKTFN